MGLFHYPNITPWLFRRYEPVQEVFDYTGEYWRKELLLDVRPARLAAGRDLLEKGLA